MRKQSLELDSETGSQSLAYTQRGDSPAPVCSIFSLKQPRRGTGRGGHLWAGTKVQFLRCHQQVEIPYPRVHRATMLPAPGRNWAEQLPQALSLLTSCSSPRIPAIEVPIATVAPAKGPPGRSRSQRSSPWQQKLPAQRRLQRQLQPHCAA